MLRFVEFFNEKKAETAPAPTPVKPKEKEKEKEKPSVDPFKRRPFVKPGEEPKPKATTKKNEEAVLEQKISSKGGMAYASYTQTEDNVGYDINFSFQGSVRKGELPKNWKEQMESALNEAEQLLMEKLPWIQ